MRVISGLGERLSSVFEKTAPDPFVIAVLLTGLTAALAIGFGYQSDELAPIERSVEVLDAWRSGLWGFLGFGMQMCLVLVTGYAVAVSRPVRFVVDRLASLPRTGRQAVALVGSVAMLCGLLNWGVGLIVGALLAREVGRRLRVRGVAVHEPLLAASGYLGMLVWHGGLSGSAPLVMSREDNARSVLPEQVIDAILARGESAAVGLDQTVLTPGNLLVTGGLVVIALGMIAMLHPAADRCERAMTIEDEPAEPIGVVARTVPDWLERTRWVGSVLGLAFVAAAVRAAWVEGVASVGLNEINVFLLGVGLLLHGSARSYAAAIDDGARSCGGIILQFPLYAGIAGIMTASGLAQSFSAWVASVAVESEVDGMTEVLSFLSAALVNLFVPSGGGQWGVQGPVALEAGAAAGVAPGRMVMAVAYGDQLTNMLQPFWALPLLAITGVKARKLVGYTAVVMVVGGVWIVGCLVIG